MCSGELSGRGFSSDTDESFCRYVPRPNPTVFRITKTNHNILHGVSDPDVRFSDQQKTIFSDWITHNAKHFWLPEGGPLSSPSNGGAHVVIIDDPQMAGLIPLIKDLTPNRPVIYRSHIEIRSDLVAQKGSPQEGVWQYLWESIRLADLFISHPIKSFVPQDVPAAMLGLLPASTDWLVDTYCATHMQHTELPQARRSEQAHEGLGLEILLPCTQHAIS
jgi:hypothetical protein